MATEWLTLALLVPLVIVPIVLLFGFSGCDIVFNLHVVALKPTITVAAATSVSEIHLEWTYDRAGSVKFEVLRTKSNETTPTSFPDLTGNTFDDVGLEEATSYLYRVIATEDVEGPPSEPVTARSNTAAAANSAR